MKLPYLSWGIVAAALAVAGCTTTFESKKIDYKSAGKLPPLEIPPDLTSPTRDDRYAVPDISPKGVATYSTYSAERAGQPRSAASGPEVLPDSAKMRIERSGSQRWLVVAGTPAKLWPTIKEFWQETGFLINLELPDAGIVETDWAENRAKIPQDAIRSVLGKVVDGLYSVPERDKFRTRLEQGSDKGLTEIYISHRGMVEVYTSEAKDSTKWQPRPADPELEAEMLRRLMVRLGADETRANAAIAQQPTVPERARLVKPSTGAGYLEVQESFDRAWRRVGLALDRVGFTVEDRDRVNGVYFVRYIDPEADLKGKKEEGVLSKLAFWRSKDGIKTGDRYQIEVKSVADKSVVRVLSKEGGADNSESGKKILGLLHDQLK